VVGFCGDGDDFLQKQVISNCRLLKGGSIPWSWLAG
jgi:hypothetical protein